MRNVSRIAIPGSLRRNARKWTDKLLDEVNKQSGDTSKVDDKFFNKYNKEDVKATLKKMYNSLCCYCEGDVNVVDFPQIEHRKPKKKYPEETYNWDNLHLSCGKCNKYKDVKFNTAHPILDSVTDIPINQHLSYEFVAGMVLRTSESKRGETTIGDTKLDRDELALARAKIFSLAIDVIKKINRDPDSPKNITRRRKLDIYCKGQFGSLVEFAMETFLR